MIQVVIILVLLMGAGGFGAYSWIVNLQAENQILQVNQEKLEGAVAEQEKTIANQQAEAAAIQEANSELRDAQTKLRADSKNLANKLGKHELDILAQNKPGLVDRIINRASGAELRCFANPNLGKEITE